MDRTGQNCLGVCLPRPPTSAWEAHRESPGKDSGLGDSSLLASGALGRDRKGPATGKGAEPAEP